MYQNEGGRILKTTNTSLEIIELIAEHDGTRMKEIANEFDLAISTVHNHLNTLRRKGFIVKHGEVYHLAVKMSYFGQTAKSRDPRFKTMKRKASELAEITSEEAGFSIEENGRAVTVFDEVGNRTVDGFQVGNIYHMHNTASGKAMLAEMSDDKIDAIIDRWGLPAVTSNTITETDRLVRELETIRERGYAVNNEETFEGLKAVAVALENPDGTVFGALDISGPSYRLPDEAELANLLSETVEEIQTEARSIRVA